MTVQAFGAQYSQRFQEQLLSLPSKTLDRVLDSIKILRAMPGLGRAYEPEYDADTPPFSCRFMIVPRTTKCLYFTVDDEAHVLRFFLLGDTRQNPKARFMGIQHD